MLDPEADVLIVGAGPTGLTLAAALTARGVRTTVIDRLPEGSNTSRAAVVHARTLEVLEALEVSERLAGLGVWIGLPLRDETRREPSRSRALGVPAATATAIAPPVRETLARAAEVKALAPERYKVQFTVSRETHDKLREAQNLLRHRIPDGDIATVFERDGSGLARRT